MEALHNPKAVAAVQGIQEGQCHGLSLRKDFTCAQLSFAGRYNGLWMIGGVNPSLSNLWRVGLLE